MKALLLGKAFSLAAVSAALAADLQSTVRTAVLDLAQITKTGVVAGGGEGL